MRMQVENFKFELNNGIKFGYKVFFLKNVM